MFASLSVYGLWEWDNSLFDNMVLPADLEDHRQDLISEILVDCSDFSLLYPNWDFMKALIGVWSRNEQRIWEKMLESELIEFNPIENYNRYESISRAMHSRSTEDTSSAAARVEHSDSDGQSSSAGNTTSAGRSSSTGNTDSRAGQTAYDSDSIKETSRSTGAALNSGSSEDHSASQDQSHNAQTVRGVAQETGSGKREAETGGAETTTSHVHGNIGVTQAADMLERFRDVSQFCTVQYIVDSFKNRFCVQVF